MLTPWLGIRYPTLMGRTTEKTIYSGRAVRRPQEETMLALWLKAHGVSKNKFALMIGCSSKMVDLWTSGRVIPGLIYALKIEQQTQGGVGMEMWVGTSIGKAQWNALEKRITING